MMQKQNKRPYKRRFGLSLLAFILLLGATAVSFMIRQSEVAAAKRYVESLEAEIEYYRTCGEALLEQKDVMYTDEYIEKVARDKLGLVMPGEVQYMLIDCEE